MNDIRCPRCNSLNIGTFSAKKLGVWCKECALKFREEDIQDSSPKKMTIEQAYDEGIKKAIDEALFQISIHDKRGFMFYKKGFDCAKKIIEGLL
jgi:hypothetical protein